MAKVSFDTVTGLVHLPGATWPPAALAYGSANVKGAWTQLIASTAADASAFNVALFEQGGGFESHLVDIALGGAGSEVVLVANLCASGRGAYGASGIIPLSIPAGSRVSARAARSQGNNAIRCSIELVSGVMPTSSVAETLGAVTASSKMTAVDPGGTGGTKGAWVELDAALAQDVHWMVVMCNVDADNSTDQIWGIDIGTGAAASEVVVIPDINVALGGGQGEVQPRWQAFAIPVITSGTRVAARCRSNQTATPARNLNIGIVAINRVEPAAGGGSGGGLKLAGRGGLAG